MGDKAQCIKYLLIQNNRGSLTLSAGNSISEIKVLVK